MHQSINKDIIRKKKEVMNNMVDAGYQNESVSAAKIKEMAVMGEARTNIFAFCERYKIEMEGKRGSGTLYNWSRHLKKLEAYHGSKDISFEQITADFLIGLERYLRTEGVDRDLLRSKNPGNYINTILKTIRLLFNAAIKKGLITCYPFKNFEMPETSAGNKDHMTLGELDKLERFVQETSNLARKEIVIWFLFGCYTGLRISDWYAFSHENALHDGYFSLEAVKNKGRIAMPVHGRLKKVLEWTKQVPLTTYDRKINSELKKICKDLKINKKPTSHSGRGTFAITLCAERGISSETCAKLLGISIEVCINNYYKVTPHKVKNETERAWSGL
jgi:site-specific recombinase XerD